jgi:hypothetical protein
MNSFFKSGFFGFLSKAATIVIAIWAIALAGKEIYNFAYDNAYKAFEQQVNYLKLKIEDLEQLRAADSSRIDTLVAENEQLSKTLYELRTTKIVLKDTIIYEGEALTLFDGKLTIECESVNLWEKEGKITSRYVNIQLDAVDERMRSVGSLSPGEQAKFSYKKREYIFVVLGVREYEGGPGAKIAVYKGK